MINNSNTDIEKLPLEEIQTKSQEGFCSRFWSYREMRLMVAMCVVLFFAISVLPKSVEINVNHRMEQNRNPIEIDHNIKNKNYTPLQIDIKNNRG